METITIDQNTYYRWSQIHKKYPEIFTDYRQLITMNVNIYCFAKFVNSTWVISKRDHNTILLIKKKYIDSVIRKEQKNDIFVFLLELYKVSDNEYKGILSTTYNLSKLMIKYDDKYNVLLKFCIVMNYSNIEIINKLILTFCKTNKILRDDKFVTYSNSELFKSLFDKLSTYEEYNDKYINSLLHLLINKNDISIY